jgi:GNAT superfamily N-acetyltransferase
MYIRKIQPRDVPACAEIVRLNWGDVVAERFRDEVCHVWIPGIKWPPMYYVALDCEPEDDVENPAEEIPLMGFAGMMESWLMNGVWDFIWINVHPEYQGDGVGKRLTETRILEVRIRGGSAIHIMTKKYTFFRQFDFRVAHVYLDDVEIGKQPENWILMTKQLKALRI